MSVGIEAARLSVVVTTDSTKAEAGLKKLDQALTKAGDSAKTAAQKIASDLNRKVDELEGDLRKGASAAKALSAALGPELASKVDVNALVGKFRDLGAEFEDIQANADQLASTVRRMSEMDPSVTRSALGFKQLGNEVHRTGTETDRSRGVLANFVGNAAQDIPGVAGSFGALNVAVGQFAEYATEGGISLKGLAASMGPIAAGTVAVSLISKYFDNIAKSKAFSKEQAEGFAKGMKDGLTAVESIQKRLEEIGKIQIWQDNGLLGGGAKDVSASLAKVGLKIDEVAQIAGGGQYAIDGYTQKLRTLYLNGQISRGTFLDVGVAIDTIGKAVRDAASASAIHFAVFGASAEQATTYMDSFVQMGTAGVISTEDLGSAAVAASPGIDTLSVAFGTAATHAGDMADEAARADQKIRDLADTVVGRADAAFAYADQVRATADLEEAYLKAQAIADNGVYGRAKTLDRHGKTVMVRDPKTHKMVADTHSTHRDANAKEIEDAKKLEEDYAQALLHTAEAFADQSDAVKNTKDETEKAKIKNDLMVQSLQAQADKLAPGSPLRQYLAEWIAELNGIPSVVSTTIALAGTGKNIGALLPSIQMAEGGVVMPRPGGTLATIGEAGKPEAVIPLDRLGSLGGGVHIGQVTLVAHPGTNGAELGRQFIEYVVEAERVYGKQWRQAA